MAVAEAVVAAKNATLALGSSCNSWYELKGGARAQYRGRYEQYGTASTSCNGKPVYRNAAEGFFLFYASSDEWWVSTEASTRDCSHVCWIHSVGACACPNSAGCRGKCRQATGQNKPEKACQADVWCPDCGLWWYMYSSARWLAWSGPGSDNRRGGCNGCT